MLCASRNSELHVQVPIFDLLKKFDNQHTSDDIKAGRRRFKLTKLPVYMVLHIKRFTKNNFFVEKNPTIVNFPVKNLELRDVVPVPSGVCWPSPQCVEGWGLGGEGWGGGRWPGMKTLCAIGDSDRSLRSQPKMCTSVCKTVATGPTCGLVGIAV